MRRSLFVAAATLIALASPALADSPFSAIYSFGDSLSDVGNVYLATGGAQPAAPYSLGRYSNGPIWVQDLSSKLGLPMLTPSLIPGGNDYAFGGATTGNPSTDNSVVPSLDLQVLAFLAAHGSAPANNANALFTFSIGANDLLGLLNAPGLTLSDMEIEAAKAAAVVATEAGLLESYGARHLIVLDVPDLGLTPYVRGLGKSAEGSALAAAFNADVFSDLAPAEAAGLKVYDPHAYALLDAAVANPTAFGLSDVTDPCWAGDFVGKGSECGNPDAYLFWDAVHPTKIGQQFIADAALSAIPEPSTWVMLLLGFAGIALAGYCPARAARAA